MYKLNDTVMAKARSGYLIKCKIIGIYNDAINPKEYLLGVVSYNSIGTDDVCGFIDLHYNTSCYTLVDDVKTYKILLCSINKLAACWWYASFLWWYAKEIDNKTKDIIYI